MATPSFIPHRKVEERLVQASRAPDVLYEVVELIWSSLLYGTRRDASLGITCRIGTKTSYAACSNGAAPSPSPPQPPPLLSTQRPTGAAQTNWNASIDRSPLAAAEDVDTMEELALPPRLSANGVAGDSSSDGAVGSSLMEDAAPASPEASIFCTHPVATPLELLAAIPTVALNPFVVSCSFSCSSTVPQVEVTPLVLRVLLWWACRPLLPHRRTGLVTRVSPATDAAFRSVVVPPLQLDVSGSVRGGLDAPLFSGGVPPGGSGELQDCLERGFALTLDDAAPSREELHFREAHQLRRRIAEIFLLLCRREGGGAVVSDALLYGHRHDASTLAAQRCRVVFNKWTAEEWLVATATPRQSSAEGTDPAYSFSNGVSATRDAAHQSRGLLSTPYQLLDMLSALLRLHTRADMELSNFEVARPPLPMTTMESEVETSGVLLRTLLRCPSLHRHFTRLLTPSERHALPAHYLREQKAAAATNARISPLDSQQQQQRSPSPPHPPAARAAEGNAAQPKYNLADFIPILTHASPTVSAAAWQTFEAILFLNSHLTTFSSVTRLLFGSSSYTVQRVLAAALSLPGDPPDRTGTQLLPASDSASPSCASHPMARNSALQLLHRLCTAHDVPSSVRNAFLQCPALLWRLLSCASALCRGIPVARVDLVQLVLADYVEAASSPGARKATNGTAAGVSIDFLLNENKASLAVFLSAPSMRVCEYAATGT